MPARQLDCRFQLRHVVHLRDADRRAEARRLDEHGIVERAPDRVAVANRVVLRDGNAAVAHHLLEEVLVHRERRAGDARADVRDAGELEQALHRPVLAERPVQDREHDVDVGDRARDLLPGQAVAGLERLLPGAELPAPLAVDLHGDDLVAAGLERADDARGGSE